MLNLILACGTETYYGACHDMYQVRGINSSRVSLLLSGIIRATERKVMCWNPIVESDSSSHDRDNKI